MRRPPISSRLEPSPDMIKSAVASTSRPGKVGFVSLGCPKALVDSERILTQLKIEGYETSASYADADVVVVNTCGFIDSAVAESLEAIGEAVAENGRVIVTGCLGARANLIREQFPDVLSITGPAAYEAVVQAVHDAVPQSRAQSLHRSGSGDGRQAHAATLRLSEDLGRLQSQVLVLHHSVTARQTASRVESERFSMRPQGLARSGVKELLVISQDTSAYGLDLKYRTDFWDGRPLRSDMIALCKELGRLVPWVRLHYVYPYPHVDRVVAVDGGRAGAAVPRRPDAARCAADSQIDAQTRGRGSHARAHRGMAQRSVPELTIRSTFIVGFPGETDAEFEALLQFLTDADLDRVGCFAYSDVDGAAANDLPDPVPEDVKQERLGAADGTSGRRSVRGVSRQRSGKRHAGVDRCGRRRWCRWALAR